MIIASFTENYPDILTVVADEIHPAYRNVTVPYDWIIREKDKEVMKLNCPPRFNHVTQDDVSIVFI